MERLAADARTQRSVESGTIDEAALNAVLHGEQRDAVGAAMTTAQRRLEENHYNQDRFHRLRRRAPAAPRSSPVDRQALRRRVAVALRPPTPPRRPARPAPAPGPLPDSVLARSRAWLGSMQEDLAQWDRLPCPATTIDRTNYVLARDGRGAALLTLILAVALLTMLVRAFV